MPKQEAYVEANKYYLNKQYSQVVDTLEKYKADQMPVSLQYELAISYVQTNQGNLLLDQHKKKSRIRTHCRQTRNTSCSGFILDKAIARKLWILQGCSGTTDTYSQHSSPTAMKFKMTTAYLLKKTKQLDPIIKEMAKYEEKETTETSTNDSSDASQTDETAEQKSSQKPIRRKKRKNLMQKENLSDEKR